MLYTQHTIQCILVGTKMAIPSSSEYTSGFYGLVTKRLKFPGASINNQFTSPYLRLQYYMLYSHCFYKISFKSNLRKKEFANETIRIQWIVPQVWSLRQAWLNSGSNKQIRRHEYGKEPVKRRGGIRADRSTRDLKQGLRIIKIY